MLIPQVQNPSETSLFSPLVSQQAANSLTDLSNIAVPSNMLQHAQMQPAYNVFMPYAPIFHDITITPCYDLEQESYAFSSTMQNAAYLATPQQEANGVFSNNGMLG